MVMEDKKKNIFSTLFDLIKSKDSSKDNTNNKNVEAQYYGGGYYNTLFAVGYNGEKNLGEVGPVKKYMPEYDILRLRSWQSFLESEITQTVFGKLTSWVIGNGLRLQSEPAKLVLAQDGIKLNAEDFSKSVEARFNLFRESNLSDYSSQKNLDWQAELAFKNAIIGGDVLVILRYVNDNLTIQLVDGANVQSPFYGTESMPYVLDNGNRIMYGVEVDSKRKIVAYYVRCWENPDDYFKFERIPAIDEVSGLTTAFLVYGLEYRLDNMRGLPLISGVLETLKKMERYKEATLGSAEERAKIVLAIEHSRDSTGESPLLGQLTKAHNYDNPLDEQLPKDVNGENLANTIAATTNKQTYNMPIGSKLTSLDTKNDLYFKDFYTINIDSVCSTLNIPPDVAKSMYNSNFSASRAALKDWEHTLHIKRKKFSYQFYRPIYKFWMHIQVLKNKVNAPGYLMAVLKNNNEVISAYTTARWVGSPVPHIDPLKEVNAERAKLGASAAALPLTTLEAATEHLNSGESESNLEQYANELKKAKALDIIDKEEVILENKKNNEEED